MPSVGATPWSRRRARRRRRAGALTAGIGALALLGAGASGAQAAPARVAFALSGSNLLSFDPATPSVTQAVPITGISGSETLVGIDVRPQNGTLYALGVNAGANTATLYVVGRSTGFAAVVGSGPGLVAFTTNGTTPVDLPDPASVGYGFDVNPAADRIRVVAGSLNFRIDPNSGAPVDGDNTGLSSGTVTGTNPDGATNGASTTVDASAYTDNRQNATITTLYTLDAASNSLFVQSSPNGGTQSSAQPVTLGGSPLNFQATSGFDIDSAVSATSSNTPVLNGAAYAVLNVGGTTGLYTINLVSGQATLVGSVGNGTTAVQGLAVQRDADEAGFPVVSLSSGGTSLVRFASATPGTSTNQPINLAPVPVGETLVGLTVRPQTGQYLVLGVNPTTDNASLYRVDPQTGVLTAIGATGGITWFAADGTTKIDLPDPATAAYGVDVNPTVDRVRVVTSTGLNARVNPVTGAAVDGNLNAGTPPGVNPDQAINGGGVTGVSATAYTNAFAQSLTGGTTVQYTIDAVTDSLYVQNLPNAGTQTLRLPLTLGGAPVDVSTLSDFDIPGDVTVPGFFTPGTGEAIAALRIGGVTQIHRLDLAAGALTSLGASAVQLRSVAVGDAQRDRPVVARSPGSLPFPSRDVDDGPGAALTSTFTNPGSTPVTLTALTFSGAGATSFSQATGDPTDCAVGRRLTTGQTCTLRVQFNPDATGAKAATVTVTSNAPEVTVALSGTGTQTAVTAAPPALDFPARDVAAGASLPSTSTLTVGGTEPVTLGALTVGGVAAADFTVIADAPADCVPGRVLGVGQTCDLRVRFDPSAVGARSASLLVTGTGPAVALALTGTGTRTVPTISRVRKARLSKKVLDTGVNVACPKASVKACTGSVQVVASQTVRGKVKRFTVGRATFSVRPGASRRLKVTPKATVRRRLQRTKRLTLTTTVATSDSAGKGLTKRFSNVVRRGRA